VQFDGGDDNCFRKKSEFSNVIMLDHSGEFSITYYVCVGR